MSRKWERMVQKNSKAMNEKRQKTGQSPIGPKDEGLIRGRSWVFPLALASIGLMFAFLSPQDNLSDPLFYITIVLYLLMALYHFALRRPYVRFSKNHLGWRAFRGEKTIPADKIHVIAIGDNQSLVLMTDGKTQKSFSRWYHLFPMDDLNESLRKFAAANHISIHRDTKE